MSPARGERHDENTMVKVLDSLREAGLSDLEAHDCVRIMQNKGLLFRERSNVIPLHRAPLEPVTNEFYSIFPPEVS